MPLRRRHEQSAPDHHSIDAERERNSIREERRSDSALLHGVLAAFIVLGACYEIATEGPSLFRIVFLIVMVPLTFILFRVPWQKAKRARRLKRSLRAAREKRRARLAERR